MECEKVVECVWHKTEVQTQDCGVIYGGFPWGVWGTPAYQV